MSEKAYLGDGVYVDRDDFGLILTTEDGYAVTNRIYLDPEVWQALDGYVNQLKKEGGDSSDTNET